MPKVYFDALSSSYVAGRAAGPPQLQFLEQDDANDSLVFISCQ